MKNFFVAIVSEGLFSLVALLVIGALIWFGGDYFGFAIRVRIMVLVAVLAIWLVLYLIQRVLAVRRAMRIEAMLRAQASSGQVVQTSASPTDSMQTQFRQGVEALRATRAGKSAVLKMPWFLVMGPPGAGKTTAIRESGLNFPFVGLGHRANAAAGATRSLDWWYADHAVFLDAAGSYISDRKRHAEWLSLIRLLSRTGRARPVDGVVLVVSIAELVALEEDRISDHAQNLRDRIDELSARLVMTFPIHLVFSHCDQLHGFSDFFAHFTSEQRGQAWGCTLDWQDVGPQGLQAKIDEEFRRLSQSLGMHRIEALAAANGADASGDLQRNALLFPIQFALLQRRVSDYIAALTRPNPFQESGRLRGFWLSSAAQGGEPIDRVLSSMGLGKSQSQNVPAAVAATVAPGEQKSYFLNGPFAKIIPADQGLARTTIRAQRQHRRWSTAVALLTMSSSAALGILLIYGYRETSNLIERIIADGTSLRAQTKDSLGDKRELSAQNASLSGALFVNLQRFAARDGIPVTLYPGLQFTRELSEKARAVSARPLVAAYTARVVADLSGRLTNPNRTLAGYEDLHERFRMYLMLCGMVPIDSTVFENMLEHKLFGDDGSVAADQLLYIVTRFPVDEWSVATDSVLVARATTELRDALWVPLTGVEIDQAGATLYPAVELATLMPNRQISAFALDSPQPGYYTQQAWDGFVAHAIEERAQALAQRFAELHIDLDRAAISQRLVDRYRESFANNWRRFPSHVRMTPPRTLDAAITGLGEFGHEGSSYRAFIIAWLQQKALVTGVVEHLAAVPLDEKAEAKKIAWIDQTLNAVGILHAALSNYATACPIDARLGNTAELDKAIAACATFTLRTGEELAAYPEEVPRRAFIIHMRELADNARIALECEPLLEAIKIRPGVAMAISNEDLVRRLQSVGIPEFPRLWSDVLAALSVPRAANPMLASSRLASLSSSQGPFAQTLRAAWRGQRLKSQIIGAQGSVTPEKVWIESVTKALQGLSAAYTVAVDAEPGPRIARTAILKQVAEAFAFADRDINNALASIDDESFRSIVARPLAEIQDDARNHLFALLAIDADQFWDKKIYGLHQREFAATFPFVDVPQDADPDKVTLLLAPKKGSLWEVARFLDAAAEISIKGQPLIRCTEEYHRSLVSATELGNGLFARDKDDLLLAFDAEIRPRAGVFQAEVTIGKDRLRLSENPRNSRSFSIPLSGPTEARIALQVADGRWLEAAEKSRAWGVLRWFQGGTPALDSDGRLVFTWQMTDGPVNGLTKAYLIQLAIDRGPAIAVLSRRAFNAFTFPATITNKPQE